jgi:hypothetical protein
MKIEISERLQPFSHCPGTTMLIPGTAKHVVIYPTKVQLPDRELLLPLTGPVKEFTVMLDLERERIAVWGKAREGYFRYFITEEGIALDRDQTSLLGEIIQQKSVISELSTAERLSLGSHKKQDWEQIVRRGDLREILPHWLRLGTITVAAGEAPPSLASAIKALEQRDSIGFHQALYELFLGRFGGLLLPQTHDPLFQGILPEKDPADSDAALLSHSASLIRRAFVDGAEILPCLPPQFPCGRFLHTPLEGVGTLSLEWSKKQVRRMVLACDRKGSQALSFQQGIRNFRLRRGNLDRGITLSAGDPLHYTEGEVLWLDRFTR